MVGARHIYANPFNPEIYPILSLGIYAAVCGLGDSKLFPGGNQYDRFSKTLKRLLTEPTLSNLLDTEGLSPADIGTHSIRKGSATYVFSCSNGGPSAAAICIRAGWTLPGVQDTYIRYESAGDMIVGRYVSGLPFEEPGFAVLPPFFADIDDFIRRAIDLCFSNLPSRLIRTGSFLLASLVYHHDFLIRTLNNNHLLRRNALFGNVGLVNQLKDRVFCRSAISMDRLRPTGVPPHVHLLVAIERQTEQLKTLTVSVNGVAPAVISLMKSEMPLQFDTFSSQTLDTSISRALNRCGIVDLVHSTRFNFQLQHDNLPEAENSTETEGSTAVPAVTRLGVVGSRLTRVPSNFVIPNMSLECAWEHWCCGDPSGQYGPFRFLQWHDSSDSKKRKRLSHYRCMMMEVQTRAMANSYWYERPTVEQARAILVNVLPELPISDVTAKNRQRRKQQLKWSSVLQEIRENRRGVSN